MTAHVLIGTGSNDVERSLFQASLQSALKIDLPQEFSSDHIKLAQRDIELIGDMIKQSPDDLIQLINHASNGEASRARKIAADIGFTESDFERQGGGMLAIVIIIAVGAALLLAHD